MPRRRLVPAVLSLGLLLAISTTASANYRDLCLSVPAACEWSGPDAPALGADVCWSATAGLHLKGSVPCPSGTWPYHAEYGEVIVPGTGEVVAYAPLDDACVASAVCLDGPPPAGAESQAICCEWGVCVPLEDVPCNSTNSVAYFCFDGVTNVDGTVDCFEGEEV